jgi:hypothetical protein
MNIHMSELSLQPRNLLCKQADCLCIIAVDSNCAVGQRDVEFVEESRDKDSFLGYL